MILIEKVEANEHQFDKLKFISILMLIIIVVVIIVINTLEGAIVTKNSQGYILGLKNNYISTYNFILLNSICLQQQELESAGYSTRSTGPPVIHCRVQAHQLFTAEYRPTSYSLQSTDKPVMHCRVQAHQLCTAEYRHTSYALQSTDKPVMHCRVQAHQLCTAE